MVITRILNNNIAEVKDRNKELVVQGKGICYGRKKGDKIDPLEVNKIYDLRDSNDYNRYKDMVEYITEDFWSFTSQQLEYVEKQLKLQLNTSFYFTMLDHIFGAVQRAKKGIPGQGFLPVDIRLYYENLYDVAIVIVNNMKQQFNVVLDETEVYFIATHLLDATIGVTNATSLEAATGVVDCIVMQLKNSFENEIDEESMNYLRFMNHIRLLAARVVAINNGKKLADSKIDFTDFYKEMGKIYAKQIVCLKKIMTELDKKFHYKVSLNEKFYLLLHIIQVTNSTKMSNE